MRPHRRVVDDVRDDRSDVGDVDAVREVCLSPRFAEASGREPEDTVPEARPDRVGTEVARILEDLKLVSAPTVQDDEQRKWSGQEIALRIGWHAEIGVESGGVGTGELSNIEFRPRSGAERIGSRGRY